MNKIELTNSQCSALEEVKQEFAAWRDTRTGRGRIPESLWAAATDLFLSYGLSINRIARTMRLNYTALKTHIAKKTPVAIKPIEEATATFIELEPPQMCSDCVIEMERQSGVKIRMCFSGRVDPAVLDLGRHFLEGQP